MECQGLRALSTVTINLKCQSLCIRTGSSHGVGRPAHAQTFSVIHPFTGSDGANPFAGLAIDQRMDRTCASYIRRR